MAASVTNLTSSGPLEDFFGSLPVHHYEPGEIILHSGDSPPGVFYLRQGFVKMESLLSDGRSLTINIFKPNSYFPMTWALANIPNVYDFQVITPVDTAISPLGVFLDFIHTHPQVMLDLSRRLLIGLEGIVSQIPYLLTGNSYYRVVAAILMSARRFGQPIAHQQILITLPLTHQDIANLAGLTRETTSLVMAKLARRRLVSYHRGTLTLLRPDLLDQELLPQK